jgi:hypothetical protein
VASNSKGVNSNSSGGLYIGSSGRLFLLSPTASGRGLVATGLSAVSFAVLAVFLVILGSLAAGEASFAS